MRLLAALVFLGGCAAAAEPRPRADAAATNDTVVRSMRDATAAPDLPRDSSEPATDTAAVADTATGVSTDAAAAAVKPDASGPDTRVDAVAAQYECTQFLGPNVTGEWFDAGFEKQVSGDRWEVKAPHLSFVQYWANPTHAVWRESGCEGTFSPCATRSKCAGGKPPDRIVFVTQMSDYATASQSKWEIEIGKAIATIRAKYPSVRHVQLMTFVRSPEGQRCSGGETSVPANLDNAHKALAVASGGGISVAPAFHVANCSQYGRAPHLTSAGNAYIAEQVGKHYAREP